MSDIPSFQVPTIPIARSIARFPVRRIFCVGQNYAEHAREMGSEPNRQAPFFFAKPADAVVASGLRLPFPSNTVNLHHEVELVIALGKSGVDVKPQDVPAMIFAHAVGIDLTRRDMQAEAKKAGRPWEMIAGIDPIEVTFE
jgi:fumarylpyruvate hydrolase